MRRADCRSRSLSFEDTPRLCLTQIGRWHVSIALCLADDSFFRNPFDDRLIASGSDDGKVFIWRVPQGFTLYSDADEPTDVAPISKLTGHSRFA